MSLRTLERAFRWLTEAELLGDRLSIVWHAGEPLVVPPAWYEEAFASAYRILPSQMSVEHHFQTNATLINDRWCDFILKHGVRVGVSIDGPAHLHDSSRRTRRGGGTHSRVLAGIRRLQTAGIPLHAICVLTRQHLDHPDEVFDFFVNQKIVSVGFNIEENDGINQKSTLTMKDSSAFSRFFERIIDRYRDDPTKLSIREVDRVVETLLSSDFGTSEGNAQTVPLAMVNIGWDGSIATFSPELLGTSHARFGRFRFGSVHTDSIHQLALDSRLRLIAEEIELGVKRCRSSCLYFAFCRGGAPSNKLGETGRFDSTTTVFCTMTQKATVEVILTALERDLSKAVSASQQRGFEQ